MSFFISGSRIFHSHRIAGWKVDFGTLNVQMNDLGRFIAMYHERGDAAGRAEWRRTAQELGLHLYQGLQNVDWVLARRLSASRQWTQPLENLTLVFEGPREYLSVPYELLYDGETSLALLHPLCRRLTGLNTPSGVSFDRLIDRLRYTEAPLRVLLIAANGAGSDSEDEVAAVYDTIAQRAPDIGLEVEVDVLAGDLAHLDAVRARLTQCPYHLVHYAGQVYHDPVIHENSGLLFAGGRGDQLGHALLARNELVRLLRGGEAQLFYISAPVGPQQWGELVLRDRDYLDLFADLVGVGISNVLGLRWYAAPASKRQYATAFYTDLLTDPMIPERAAWRARRAIYTQDEQDEAWVSPLLITQHVYGLH